MYVNVRQKTHHYDINVVAHKCLHVNFLLKSRLWLRKAKNNCKQPRKAKTSCKFPIRTLSYLKSRKWDSTLNDFLKIAALATKS